MIRLIASDLELQEVAKVIRAAFLTIAEEAGFSPENCPGFPAFITDEEVQALAGEGLQFYGLFEKERLVGTVGLRRLEDSEYKMEKLAVPIEYRHRGFGRQLVDFICETARKGGGKKLSLDTGKEATVLVAWYLEQGFIEVGTRKNPDLPFTFCYLEKTL